MVFDIHKVKPIHGWREFVGEVGIIVLGVLIALGAEQVAEAFHWRMELSETTQALNTSLAASRVTAVERIYLNHCIKKQIREIEKYLADGGSGPLKVYGGPIRPWQVSPWTTAMSSGIIPHMESKTRSAYARAFDSVTVLGKTNLDELTIWSDLSSLRFSTVVTAYSRDRLEADLAHATVLNRLMVTASRQLDENAKSLGVHLGSENIDDLKEDAAYSCPV